MIRLLTLLLALPFALALGIPNILSFTASDSALTFASSSSALPILIDSHDSEALHIAVATFAEDILRVTGIRPEIHSDVLPNGTSSAVIAATIGSALMKRVKRRSVSTTSGSQTQTPFVGGSGSGGPGGPGSELEGKWEAYDVRVLEQPLDGLKEGIVVTGSDRRGTIYALYTLSELMGVSPWYWWADVPVKPHDTIAFPRDKVLQHGEPTVKYRGFFLNDEQPVLWNWAKEHFKMGDKPPFQVGMYEKVFELLLRMRGNYLWPAMWASMFGVDGQDVANGLPAKATPGPNQALAEKMGVVMGTSHHEPMSRNQKEFDTFGHGDWSFTSNEDFLKEFWRYGAERAKGLETVYTVGMRGNGDLPLDGANTSILQTITHSQQAILKQVLDKADLKDVPQMWAMYKEVMGYFANGLEVPDDVTPLLADDNWGNLMAVMPEDRNHSAGGGVYYHADYVGDPRDYKWINTVPLPKMWEQMNIARSFKTNNIWILNVGDLKLLEVPLEYFMDLAYDSDRWPRDTLLEYLSERSQRDFGSNSPSEEIARIMLTYSTYASRRKAELVDPESFSLINYDEFHTIVEDWERLEARAKAVYDGLPEESKVPFYELIYVSIRLQANLNRLYLAAAKSNLYATQGRTAANVFAQEAMDLFERDIDLTEEFHNMLGGKWRHMLSQTHIGYQYWQMPVRNSLPPLSFVSKRSHSYDHGKIVHARYTVENSLGAWPGDNKHNSLLGYNSPDPTLEPMDPYGRRRWVDVGSGGHENVNFTAQSDSAWLKAEPNHGLIRGDGTTDARVWISVDWDKLKGQSGVLEGHIALSSTDGTSTIITVPINNYTAPPSDFHGAVQGDDYVAIEAAQFQVSKPAKLDGAEYTWGEIPFFGRTKSAVSVYPVGGYEFPLGQGPSLRYDFWTTNIPNDGIVEVTLHLSPSLNFVLGKFLAVGVQMDDSAPVRIEPVPAAPLGSLPDDWEEVVANEIREVKLEMKLSKSETGTAGAGKHSLTIWGVTTGVVVERVLIDMGGIQRRGFSYLGPPESVVV